MFRSFSRWEGDLTAGIHLGKPTDEGKKRKKKAQFLTQKGQISSTGKPFLKAGFL